MATISKNSNRQHRVTIEFLGPAQEKFVSFLEQSNGFMNYHCPAWKTSSCYMIPPVFYYKAAEKNDELFEAEQEELSRKKAEHKCSAVASKADPTPFNRFVIDRLSDSAEHFVYEAINHLAQEYYQAPFVAFHNLDMNRAKKILPRIVTNPDAITDQGLQKLGEYDFLLIGPKIGLIVIEVKSSFFEQKKHFSFENKLPDVYADGIDQLNSINKFLQFLENSFSLPSSKHIPVRKIIFTPNLEKGRYSEWETQLKTDARSRLSAKLGQVIQWFKEDMHNSSHHIEKPPTYTTLQKILEQMHPISKDIFESYTPILAGLSSVVIETRTGCGKKKNMEEGIIHLDSDKYSVGLAIEIENCRVTAHDAVSKPDMKTISKIILLTPEQKAVLARRCRCLFIVGPAGVGKTIILQQRALDCLSSGQSVVVIARDAYMDKFKQVIAAEGHKKYEVRSWMELCSVMTPLMDGMHFVASDDWFQHLVRKIESNYEKYDAVFSQLFKFDHVLIDDGLDHNVSGGYWTDLKIPSLIVMAFAQVKKSSSVWIGVDMYGCFMLLQSGSPKLEPITQKVLQAQFAMQCQPELCPQENYCTVFLHHILRCSESVYSIAYSLNCVKGHCVPREVTPVLGHKIQGLPHFKIEKNAISAHEAMKVAIMCVEEQLERLFKQGILGKGIAIISTVSETSFLQQYLQTSRCTCRDATCFDCWKRNVHCYYYRNVWSLEWPVVITFDVRPQGEKLELHKDSFEYIYKLLCYYAFTRATAHIIEILVRHDEDDSEFYHFLWTDFEPGPERSPSYFATLLRRRDFRVNSLARKLCDNL